MEHDRRRNRIEVGLRMRADFFVLPDVVVLADAGRHQRPERFLLLFPYVQKARTDRRVQPLVQAGAVVVHAEFIAREREVGEGMRAIHEYFDPFRPRHVDDLTHRHDLAGQVRDVRHLNHPGPRCDRSGKRIHHIFRLQQRHRELHLLQHDPFATHALFPRVDHATVVLRRDDHFIAALEIESEDHGLVRL